MGAAQKPKRVGALHLSDDGKWIWDGSRWSARRITLRGSIIPRILAWSLLAAIPLGSFAGVFGIAPLFVVLIRLTRPTFTLGMSFNTLQGFGALAGAIVAEALLVWFIVRHTPQISIENGMMRIRRVSGSNNVRQERVADVESVKLVRGRLDTLMLTKGMRGEGKVLICLRHLDIELGWDAFAGRASRLAWALGVPLLDSAATSKQNT